MASRTFSSLPAPTGFLAHKHSIEGDSGADTLGFSAGVTFNDDTLSGMTAALVNAATQLEVLTLSGSTDSVTLGANAEAVGI